MRSAATSVFFVLTVSLSLSLIDLTSTVTFPKEWKRCKQSDPELNKCLSEAVIDAVRKLENTGEPTLGVQSIDPLDVKKMEITPLNLKLILTNLKITGMAKSKITDHKTNLKENKFYTKSLTPVFTMNGDYNIDGKMLVMKVQGEGKCKITLTDVTTEHLITFEPYQKDGKEYRRLKEYKITLDPKGYNSQFDNLFNGNKLLGPVTNTFINANWKTIFNDMKPVLVKTFGDLFKEMGDKVFDLLPFDEIFLP